MKRCKFLTFLISVGTILFCCAQLCGLAIPQPESMLAQAPIVYDVKPIFGENPHLQIVMQLPPMRNPRLQMPVWCPGDYHIQNFAQYVSGLQAKDKNGHMFLVQHPDPNTWQVETGVPEAISVSYVVAMEPPGLFSENVQIRENQVFINGSAAFLYVMGQKERPTQLLVDAPKEWEVIVPLDKQEGAGKTVYNAQDYDALVDAPILIAAPDDLLIQKFSVDGIVHKVVFFDHPQEVTQVATLTNTLKRIVAAEDSLMGGPPYRRYIFYFDVDGRGGGLEHRDSARLVYRPEETLTDFAAFAAHEFFHLWNVKRIRPQVLGPFDYVNPPHTHSLWFVEGVTDYFAWLSILRAGLISPEQFLAHWRRAIQSYLANPAHLQVSAEEASWRVWESGTSDGYGGLSYYDKGALIGLCLDLELRAITQNRKSLVDVMHLLLKRYAPPHAGYTANDLRLAVNEVAGQDISEFYNRLTQTVEEMPFATCLAYAGLSRDCEPLPNAPPEAVAIRDRWLQENE